MSHIEAGMKDYRKALAAAIGAAREAGSVLRDEFHFPGGPRGTTHRADVDEVAERLIRERLLAAEPWSYLGEETGRADGDRQHIWVVDPNDGTSSYMRGRRGSAVSIAALRDGIPVLGVVYAFSYPDDEGDLIAWAEGCGPATRNGSLLGARLDDAKLGNYSVVFVSQDADRNPGANARCVAPARFRSLPSIAYRLALVAAGEGVAAVSLNGPCSWDFAAGHALVRAAGGVFLDQDGKEIVYGGDGCSWVRVCFGGAPEAVRELVARPWDSVFDRSPRGAASPFGLCRPTPGRTIADPGLLSRAQGCLLGQFVGDALGAQVEFRSGSSIREEYPGGVRDLADGGPFQTMAGQPTDDSEMALMLARTLVRDRRFDAAAVLDAYLHWWGSHPFDCGGTTHAALGSAALGATPAERLERAENGALDESQANGSLMRISPIGIFGSHTPDDAVMWARQDSGLTHPNTVCRESCAAFVRAIVTALGGGGARACYDAALAEARRGGSEAVVDTLTAAAAAPPKQMEGRTAGWVLLALQNAFHHLLHSSSFEEVMVETLACGGDTDTNAAICGALLGAVHGREAIPARWRRAVLSCRPIVESGARRPRPAEFWPVDAHELAEALLLG